MISHDTTVVSYKHPQHIRKISLTSINQKVVSYNIKNSDITVTKKTWKTAIGVFPIFSCDFPIKTSIFQQPAMFFSTPRGSRSLRPWKAFMALAAKPSSIDCRVSSKRKRRVEILRVKAVNRWSIFWCLICYWLLVACIHAKLLSYKSDVSRIFNRFSNNIQ